METLSRDEKEFINECLMPLFVNTAPEFAATVLVGMLKSYMNTPEWHNQNTESKANAIYVTGMLAKLLNDISFYFPDKED